VKNGATTNGAASGMTPNKPRPSETLFSDGLQTARFIRPAAMAAKKSFLIQCRAEFSFF